jgi:hypothetical protein
VLRAVARELEFEQAVQDIDKKVQLPKMLPFTDNPNRLRCSRRARLSNHEDIALRTHIFFRAMVAA